MNEEAKDEAYTAGYRIEQRPDEYGDSTDVYFVAPDGSEHELWWDGCNRDCPEDLIWVRAIGQLFQVAFALGARYGRRPNKHPEFSQ